MIKTKSAILVLCFLILGAHFLRDGNTLGMTVFLAAPLLLFVKKRWSLILIQILLALGAIIWIDTTYSLVQTRIEIGSPWIRMAGILVAVTLLTIYSVVILNSNMMKERYQ